MVALDQTKAKNTKLTLPTPVFFFFCDALVTDRPAIDERNGHENVSEQVEISVCLRFLQFHKPRQSDAHHLRLHTADR